MKVARRRKILLTRPSTQANITITTPSTNGAAVSGTFVVKGTVIPAATTVDVQVDGGPFRPANIRSTDADWSSTWNMETLSAGSHTLTARATAPGGPFTASRTITVSSIGTIPGVRLDRWNNPGTPTNKNKYSVINSSIGSIDSFNTGLPALVGLVRDLKSVQTGYDYALPLAEARANNWLCHTISSGGASEYINTASDFNSRLLNITIPAALNRWVDYTVHTLLGTRPWVKAILIDNSHPGAVYFNPGSDFYPYEMPNYAAWRSAFAAALKTVCLGLLDAGYYVQLNISSSFSYLPGGPGGNEYSQYDTDWWTEIAPYVHCAGIEHPMRGATGTNMRVAGNAAYPAVWDNMRAWHPFVNSLGLDYDVDGEWAIRGGAGTADGEGVIYERASYLLDWNGRSGSVKNEHFDNVGDPWTDTPTWRDDVGQPTGVATQPLGTGTTQNSRVWKRTYTNKTVYVNTNQYGEVSMTVDGHVMPSPSALII